MNLEQQAWIIFLLLMGIITLVIALVLSKGNKVVKQERGE